MLLVVSNNLITRSRISAVASKLSLPCQAVAASSLAARVGGGVDTVVVDLDGFDFGVLDAKLRGLLARRQTRLIGFYPHLRRHLKEKALEKGFERVVPNRVFFEEMEALLRPR